MSEHLERAVHAWAAHEARVRAIVDSIADEAYKEAERRDQAQRLERAVANVTRPSTDDNRKA